MSKKLPRAASTYRSARRNKCRAEHLVWQSDDWETREVEAPKYRPTQARGSSADRANPGYRLPPRTYKPNGLREMARREAKIANPTPPYPGWTATDWERAAELVAKIRASYV